MFFQSGCVNHVVLGSTIFYSKNLEKSPLLTNKRVILCNAYISER